MIKILEKHKYLLSLILITIVALSITYAHNISLIVDCGREVYYPQEILNGKILYRDLFNIYGPFAYLFNALLYKIFSINLNVLCISGAFCALGIIIGLYLTTRIFLKDKFAFSIGLLAIAIGIIPCHIFNYAFPYAFAMTYGMCAFIFSLLFLVHYINSNKNIFLYFSLFLASLAICCKYEFVLYLLVYIPVFINLKPKFYTILLGFLSFSLVPEICFGYLFIKGLSLKDLINTLDILKVMSQTETLKYFYVHSGIFFHIKILPLLLKSFVILFLPIFVYLIPVIFKKKVNNLIISSLFTYGAFCLMLLFKNNTTFELFTCLPIFLLLIFIFNFKKIINNLSIFVVITGIFLYSIKIFWGPLLNSYGVYYIPFLVLAVALCFKDKLTEKEWDYTGFYVSVLSFSIFLFQFNALKLRNNLISTEKGKIYTVKYYEKTNQLLNYIKNNTKKTDKIVVFPEGMMINFLSERKTDDFYNTLLPLYEETFGINTYIEYFKKDMPEYIIFNSWNSSDYYFSIICKDYGFAFCEFVVKNYEEKIKLLGAFSYVVYKRK